MMRWVGEGLEGHTYTPVKLCLLSADAALAAQVMGYSPGEEEGLDSLRILERIVDICRQGKSRWRRNGGGEARIGKL